LKLIEIKTGVKSHILRHLGAVLIKLHRTDISPRNDKLTNGRVVNHTKVQLILNFIYFTTITKQVIQHNHARWHRRLRSVGLRVGGNRSARRKPTCLTW